MAETMILRGLAIKGRKRRQELEGNVGRGRVFKGGRHWVRSHVERNCWTYQRKR